LLDYYGFTEPVTLVPEVKRKWIVNTWLMFSYYLLKT